MQNSHFLQQSLLALKEKSFERLLVQRFSLHLIWPAIKVESAKNQNFIFDSFRITENFVTKIHWGTFPNLLLTYKRKEMIRGHAQVIWTQCVISFPTHFNQELSLNSLQVPIFAISSSWICMTPDALLWCDFHHFKNQR